MDLIEVKLLHYTFRFKRQMWRDEFNIKFPKGRDQTRVYLAHALVEVSGLPVKSIADATKIIDSLPTAISSRVFRIYKGQLPPNRRFATAALYNAPEPAKYQIFVDEEVSERDELAERAQAAMEMKFGKKELAEAAEVDRQILKASKLRGAIRVEADHAD